MNDLETANECTSSAVRSVLAKAGVRAAALVMAALASVSICSSSYASPDPPDDALARPSHATPERLSTDHIGRNEPARFAPAIDQWSATRLALDLSALPFVQLEDTAGRHLRAEALPAMALLPESATLPAAEQASRHRTARSAPSDRDWSAEQIALGVTLGMLLAADWAQTRYIASHPGEYYETNAILGRHPTRGQVDAYFAGYSLLWWALAEFLPQWRTGILGAGVLGSARFVIRNRQLGIKFEF
jgi:hypothetical protein